MAVQDVSEPSRWSRASSFVCITERRFATAALWSAIAAGLSALGLMHAYRFTATDTALSLPR